MTGVIAINNENFIQIIAGLMNLVFGVDRHLTELSLRQRIQPFIDILRDDLSVLVETDYVDKVYRDSYYNYFSSKADCFSRNCIRLSLLDNSSGLFPEKKHVGYDRYDDLKRNYLGFIVIRPTISAVVGRSAISPFALKTHDFKCCLSPICSTLNGFKVAVEAFPSSSQDGETITCAETSIWALMEYYGNKYPEYSPVKPSEILEHLEGNVFRRQLPSRGLTVENVTFALKTFGFGPQIYERTSFGAHLLKILSCYVESGIPVVVALSNRHAKEKNSKIKLINHAVLCVGREDPSPDAIDEALASSMEELSLPHGSMSVLDFDDIRKCFVFIDDNCPPYRKDYLLTPANGYVDMPDWNACRIVNFVAPLYKRIYMEPYMVKEYAKRLLQSSYYSHLNGQKIVVRTYLCSTRSFRHFANGSKMALGMKDVIASLFMPKFVWVTEISRVEHFKRRLVDNLILIDATSFSTSNFDPLLAAFVDDACYVKDCKTKLLSVCTVSTNPFESYCNLK